MVSIRFYKIDELILEVKTSIIPHKGDDICINHTIYTIYRILWNEDLKVAAIYVK